MFNVQRYKFTFTNESSSCRRQIETLFDGLTSSRLALSSPLARYLPVGGERNETSSRGLQGMPMHEWIAQGILLSWLTPFLFAPAQSFNSRMIRNIIIQQKYVWARNQHRVFPFFCRCASLVLQGDLKALFLLCHDANNIIRERKKNIKNHDIWSTLINCFISFLSFGLLLLLLLANYEGSNEQREQK